MPADPPPVVLIRVGQGFYVRQSLSDDPGRPLVPVEVVLRAC